MIIVQYKTDYLVSIPSVGSPQIQLAVACWQQILNERSRGGWTQARREWWRRILHILMVSNEEFRTKAMNTEQFEGE